MGSGNKMADLTYKEFMEDVRRRLAKLSVDDFKHIFLNKASEVHPAKRHEFLAQLNPPQMTEYVSVLDCETIMAEIADFAKRVVDGEYCDGWGWDNDYHEERDWGDESWSEEMDDFFLDARELLIGEETKLAEEAYRQLFDTLELGQEPGHLPGDPDSTNMLEADLDEQVALFCRAVYLNASSEARPDSVFEAINDYGYFAHKVTLKKIIGALDTPLPGFDAFLSAWIELLSEQNQGKTGELLREAIMLQGGVAAISSLARQYPEQYPKAYLDWLSALDPADTKSALEVAREGLSNIPRDYIIRAQVAQAIAQIGEQLGDRQLKLEGYRERFISDPSVNHLLDLYLTAFENGTFEAIRELSEQRIGELQGKSRSDYNSERNTAYVTDGIVAQTLLLGGRYERVFELCQGQDSLGWSFGDNSKPLLITFLLTVLAGEGKYSKFIGKYWEYVIRRNTFYTSQDYVKKYQKAVGLLKDNIQLTGEQEVFYLKWCLAEVGQRVDAIVSNQYRGSYDKAAELLVAMVETLANREGKQAGLALIEKYRNKYPRHTAFKNEINRAVRESGLTE